MPAFSRITGTLLSCCHHRNIWCFVFFVCLALSSSAQDLPSPSEPPLPVESIESRVDSLTESHRQLTERLNRLMEENESLTERLNTLQPIPPSPDSNDRGGRSLLSGLPATDDDDQPPDIRTDEPLPKSKEQTTKSTFHEGFKWSTEDGEFTLNFHNETQLDTRAYGQAHMDPTNQFGFYIPRMRMIFNGRLTKPIEYNISINKGTGDLNLLDAYLNFNYDPRFQFRLGRFRVPFTYDWFALSNQFLTTPERSVFATNLGYNRNFAAMIHGEVWQERMEYAFALANGPRNSYFDTNASKDLLAFVNARPFMNWTELPALKNLNLGGSFTYGLQDQPPLPVYFHTSANATDSEGTLEAAPSFLKLNDDVLEQGIRKMWELHFAYYYKHLTFLGAYDGGFNDYQHTANNTRVRVPTRAYHVQFGYFLTGEEIERRTFVEPIRPFDLRPGKRGPGAWELQARYDHFTMGNEVFTGKLADPTEWTNRVDTVDAGLNWYLNKYTKIYFDWQHAMYGNPVMYAPGRTSRSSDLFWIRTQIYF